MRATDLAQHAQSLRQEFDRGFAAPPRAARAAHEDLLSLRIGTESCALRLMEIAGLFVDKIIMPVPGGAAAALGLAGFRGALVAVYDLPVLLGHPRSTAPRWLVTLKRDAIALAFEHYEGHLRAPPDAFFNDGFVRAGGAVRTLIRISAVLDTLRNDSLSKDH
jgi:hypothetical protein